jgi:hypothetical protein
MYRGCQQKNRLYVPHIIQHDSVTFKHCVSCAVHQAHIVGITRCSTAFVSSERESDVPRMNIGAWYWLLISSSKYRIIGDCCERLRGFIGIYIVMRLPLFL